VGKVYELPKIDVDDIPALLEEMAAAIRAGDHGEVRMGAGIFVTDGDEPIVCGWGRDATAIQSIGLFQLAACWLSVHEVKR
jgi:hypothetical protein